MDTYEWYDYENEERGEIQRDTFTAVESYDAIMKAAWIFIGEIGEQHEYDLPIVVINTRTNKKTKTNIHVDMIPEFSFQK